VLIGAEFGQIASQKNRVVIGGSGRLAEFYSSAFGHMASGNVEWMELDPDELDSSIVVGQSLFLKNRVKL
jgi:hypothetical protein